MPGADVDLTGKWQVTHRVATSERPDFVGLSIGFEITLSQSGSQLAGGGKKWRVDQHLVDPDESSQLEITGWMRGSDVQISLLEILVSADRINVGEVTWTMVNRDCLIGTFRVDLAETAGSSQALRVA